MLSYAKSGTARPGDRLNGFENGKTQLFNSGGVVKFPKKVEYPFKLIMQGDLLRCTLINLLVFAPLFNGPKKACLKPDANLRCSW